MEFDTDWDLWGPPYYQDSDYDDHMQQWWQGDFYYGYGFDPIKENAINEESCVHVLRIMIGNADSEIDQLEKELLLLQSELAWFENKEWSEICSNALNKRIDYLDMSIRKLKDNDMNDVDIHLLVHIQPPESLDEILKALLKTHLHTNNGQLGKTEREESGTNHCLDIIVYEPQNHRGNDASLNTHNLASGSLSEEIEAYKCDLPTNGNGETETVGKSGISNSSVNHEVTDNLPSENTPKSDNDENMSLVANELASGHSNEINQCKSNLSSKEDGETETAGISRTSNLSVNHEVKSKLPTENKLKSGDTEKNASLVANELASGHSNEIKESCKSDLPTSDQVQETKAEDNRPTRIEELPKPNKLSSSCSKGSLTKPVQDSSSILNLKMQPKPSKTSVQPVNEAEECFDDSGDSKITKSQLQKKRKNINLPLPKVMKQVKSEIDIEPDSLIPSLKVATKKSVLQLNEPKKYTATSYQSELLNFLTNKGSSVIASVSESSSVKVSSLETVLSSSSLLKIKRQPKSPSSVQPLNECFASSSDSQISNSQLQKKRKNITPSKIEKQVKSEIVSETGSLNPLFEKTTKTSIPQLNEVKRYTYSSQDSKMTIFQLQKKSKRYTKYEVDPDYNPSLERTLKDSVHRLNEPRGRIAASSNNRKMSNLSLQRRTRAGLTSPIPLAVELPTPKVNPSKSQSGPSDILNQFLSITNSHTTDNSTESLCPTKCYLEKLTSCELKKIGRGIELRNWYKLRKSELVEKLAALLPKSNLPGLQKPDLSSMEIVLKHSSPAKSKMQQKSESGLEKSSVLLPTEVKDQCGSTDECQRSLLHLPTKKRKNVISNPPWIEKPTVELTLSKSNVFDIPAIKALTITECNSNNDSGNLTPSLPFEGFENLKVCDLISIAKKHNLKNLKKLKKHELIELLVEKLPDAQPLIEGNQLEAPPVF
ncbi:hypothetical protein ACFE04_030406 [Oxalis oulophora]